MHANYCIYAKMKRGEKRISHRLLTKIYIFYLEIIKVNVPHRVYHKNFRTTTESKLEIVNSLKSWGKRWEKMEDGGEMKRLPVAALGGRGP